MGMMYRAVHDMMCFAMMFRLRRNDAAAKGGHVP